MATESSSQIQDKTVNAAIDGLSCMNPLPLAVRAELQDEAETVLFLVNVTDQSETSVAATYFKQVIPSLNALIPENEDPARWMVVFQDSTGHLITSCVGRDEYAI
ncbi:hypothetical protein [Thermomonas brevis]